MRGGDGAADDSGYLNSDEDQLVEFMRVERCALGEYMDVPQSAQLI